MPQVTDYPYDPRLRVENLTGLNKLRAVPDRELAKTLFDLWFHIENAERDGRTREWRRAEERQRDAAELKDLTLVADKALAGGYGPQAKELALEMLIDGETWGRPRRTDRASLVAFQNSLQELRRHS